MNLAIAVALLCACSPEETTASFDAPDPRPIMIVPAPAPDQSGCSKQDPRLPEPCVSTETEAGPRCLPKDLIGVVTYALDNSGGGVFLGAPRWAGSATSAPLNQSVYVLGDPVPGFEVESGKTLTAFVRVQDRWETTTLPTGLYWHSASIKEEILIKDLISCR